MNRCECCIHEKVCMKWAEIYASRAGNIVVFDGCEKFVEVDKTITLPCKVGDTVYCLVDTYIEKDICNGFFFDKNNKVYVQVICPIGSNHSEYCEIGKTGFLTKEDAEQALKENEENTRKYFIVRGKVQGELQRCEENDSKRSTRKN